MSTRKVISFEFSPTTSYIIEIGAGYFRFFKDKAQVLSSGNPYEIANSYVDADIPDLHFAAINDVIYITHPTHAPAKLTRAGDASWTFATVVFDEPAMLDQNTDITSTITVNGNTGSISLVATNDIFLANHVGSYWKLGFRRNAFTLQQAINTNVTSNPYQLVGDYTLRTYGTWAADIILEKSYDAGFASSPTYFQVQKWQGNSDENIDWSATAPLTDRRLPDGQNAISYRVVIQNYVSNTNARWVLQNVDSTLYGIVKITAVTDSKHATATVIKTLPYNRYFGDTEHILTTDLWSIGAWSEDQGYPRTVAFHENRLWFGGTDGNPRMVWGSASDDYENFERGSADSDAMAFLLVEAKGTIQWMVSQKSLIVGTAANEVIIQSNSTTAGITPSSVSAKAQSDLGSEHIQSLVTHDSVFFVQRKSTILNGVNYNYATEIWEPIPMTILADHISEGGFVQLAYQRDPIPIVWAVTSDGSLVGLTYDRKQNVMGWHRHTTDGLFKSVACLYGATGEDDQVWVIVERTIGSTAVQSIELFDPTQWTNVNDAFFVDCGVTIDGSPKTSFAAAVPHLEGLTVDVLADGVPYTGLVVGTGGLIQLPSGAAASGKLQVGLPYTSTLVPFRLDADNRLGVTAGQVKSVKKVHLRVLNSVGLRYKVDSTNITEKQQVDGTAATLTTGDVALDYPTDLGFDPKITLEQVKPLPLTILAIVANLDVTGH